jgi:hypothetical protein
MIKSFRHSFNYCPSCGNSPHIEYYHRDRTHYNPGKDPPLSRPVQKKESDNDKVIALPRGGGLHHKYSWKEAA